MLSPDPLNQSFKGHNFPRLLENTGVFMVLTGEGVAGRHGRSGSQGRCE
jgi:hypothetical protein